MKLNNATIKFMLCLVVLLIMVGCSTLPKALDPANEKHSCANEYEIFIISHGWHAGLAIKASDLNKAVPELAVRFPASHFYEVGWGDSGFYQSNQITTGLALQAMFWSTGSVLHVVGLNADPRVRFNKSKIVVLKTDSKNYQNLIQFIRSSFERDQNQEIILENHGIYGDSQFYTGIGKYHLFNTCNKWTAKALYSAGYDIAPMLKLTASSVMDAAADACPE